MSWRPPRIVGLLLLLIFMVLLPEESFATGGSGIGTIANILVVATGGTNGQGVALIYLNVGATGTPPSCATQTSPSMNPSRWATDLGTAAGQAAYAMALNALSKGWQIGINGSGNCNIWGDSEGLLIVW